MQPEWDEVLVKVMATGLCRTDLKLIPAGHRDLVLPQIPGEEVEGTIAAAGREPADCPRDNASSSISGAEHLCHGMEIMGFHRHGGFAEYVVAPAQSILPIPNGITDAEAVFAEPLSNCLNEIPPVNGK